MSITKKPPEATKFINKAPDSTAKAVSAEQVQITLKMTPALLASIDAAAKALNISRAGFIKMSLSNALKG